MKKVLRSLASTLVLVSLAEAAQAQANLVHGIVAGISLIGNASTAGSSDKSYSDKTVANVTYENRAYPMKRTPADKLTGKAADQIALLESQLQKCRMRMITSPTDTICSATQQAAIRATQASLAKAQSSWSQKYYKQELAFYLAEDVRRQRPANQPAPVPAEIIN